MLNKEYLERVMKKSLNCSKEFYSPEGKDFEAIHAAEQWARENGYTVGSMARDEPIGIARGSDYVAKWYNLEEDKELLDGAILCDMHGMRHARVITIHYREMISRDGLIDLLPHLEKKE